ncbi:hypothetical protein IE53DRAFT_372758 [Violaceomyces palustris]|uniref:Uncharacterized protein n=1 Tax=Violaceomyces palustris TaxID=1673888 RepID=A0ACD0P7B8_9BASI|nr:hypothetical protein IE53DRAFT_372758 [Violaceomyces palustris]
MNRAVTLSRKAAFKEPVRQLGQFRIAARITADGPAPRARSGRAKFLLYTTLGAAAFYSGSTVAALNNERYQDFFVESVPLGERIIDYLDTHDVGQEIKSINLGGYGEKAVGATKSAYGSVSGAVSRLLGEGSEVIDENARDARAQLAEARKKAQAQVTKVAERVEEGAKEIKVEGESSIKKVQDKTAALVEKAKKAASEAEARIKGEHPDGRGLIKKAVDSVQVNTDIGKDEVKAAPSVTPYVKALPVGHEAPAGYVAPRTDRKLEPPSDKAARLRPDPEAPKLPLLAPSIKSLSGSEPMIAQLAGTIDELSTFLRETPSSGAVAKGVLESAQRELESLSKRLEAVKREEALRVEKSLAAQAQRYEAQISKQAQEAVNKLSSKEEDWQKSFEEERARQMEEFKTKLNKELATQSEIINDRLKEEVIAQGIEMQRRWMRDIKAQVEKERGGRLARLDELASDLKELERTTLDNSSALDDNVNVHTLWTAIRSIASVIDDETRKRPFSEQLRVLKNTPKAREDDVIRAALEVIEASGVAETGVESFTTLKQWFDDKVSPRIRSVSLVPSPEQSGLLSYMVSATFSPLLFRKKGLVEGEDVPSVLSRVEHYLDRKDLDNAARELNQLKGWPKTLAKDWLDASRKRLETQQALEVVNTEASLASLLVV